MIFCQKKVNKTEELTCDGREVIVNGDTITWVQPGYDGGKGIYDGDDTVEWGEHQWLRQGL